MADALCPVRVVTTRARPRPRTARTVPADATRGRRAAGAGAGQVLLGKSGNNPLTLLRTRLFGWSDLRIRKLSEADPQFHDAFAFHISSATINKKFSHWRA